MSVANQNSVLRYSRRKGKTVEHKNTKHPTKHSIDSVRVFLFVDKTGSPKITCAQLAVVASHLKLYTLKDPGSQTQSLQTETCILGNQFSVENDCRAKLGLVLTGSSSDNRFQVLCLEAAQSPLGLHVQ